jgi:PQQ-dependent dehydrogenase (methanol/ethanol family)
LRHALAVLSWTAWLTAASLAQSVVPSARGIDAENAGSLQPIFSFRIPQPEGLSGSPAVTGGMLFLQSPFPHVIHALDLMRPDDPIRWSFAPPARREAAGLDWHGATSAGPVLIGDSLFLNTFDGHAMALEAATGRVLWDAVVADPAAGETLTAPPLVARGRAFIGVSGDDFGVRGWIEALDAETGAVLWKRFNTGPDPEVGIGRGFMPPYARDAGGNSGGENLGVRTWPPDAWRHGGGGLSAGLVYDPETDLLLHGTGHPAPWNPDLRRGENNWTSGLFARDPGTGEARWFLALAPHDRYAFGAAGSLVPAGLPWPNTARPENSDREVLIHPDANGYVYVLDRRTGAILSATPFVDVNATRRIDLDTGAPRDNPDKAVNTNSTTRDICPGWPGATGRGAAAYSPRTRLLYIPVSRLCMDMEPRDANFMRGTPFTGANLRMTVAAGRSRGALIAWDVTAGKAAWTADENFPVESGVLATGSDVVFYGTLDGWFKALDGRSGRMLWRFRTPSGIISQPIDFRLPDGRHCVAVLTGVGGVAGETSRDRIDVRDATAAHGHAAALADLKPPEDPGGAVYVFALP